MVGVPDEARPSPDAVLKAAQKESRGKFKIFFGAAPGVGKTYEMLQAASRRKAEGVDVVAGIIEWLRMPGDLIFLFVGILPVVYLALRMFAARRRYAKLPAETTTEEFTQWYEEE